ncbi:hypothetical protein TWF718_005647 [Orbilia javanica]|uniref:Uncharacterized protein n=1 Tax=Orbilia javanica TaxID=47235 RepID=A0AAN8MQ84_9PEZI
MVQFRKIQRLGILSLLLLLRAPYCSAVIINVIVSEVDDVWHENSDDALRRKDPSQESIFILCRPPPEEPWLGVYAIDPKVTSCQAGGGSANWVIRESDWERPEYLPKPPGTVLQIEGPGPAAKRSAYAISNTNCADCKEDYLTFGPALSLKDSEPSKWLVERFGNNGNYETLAPDNLLTVGDTLRFWDPEVPNGFQQLYMHRIKGSPQRFNRLRPFVEAEGSQEEYDAELAKVRKEYPAAEFRIASLGDNEIVRPELSIGPSRTQRFLKTVGSAKGRIGKLLTGGFGGQQNSGRIGSAEKIPIKKEEQRVRSEEIEIDPGDIFGNPDILDSMSPEEYIRSQQQQRMDLPQIPSLAELALRKSMKKNSPVEEIAVQFEESKSQDGDDNARRPVELERSSRSSHSANSKMNESGRGRTSTMVNLKEQGTETVYQTAIGDEYDYEEEDRLGDIIDENVNIINVANANQPGVDSQLGMGPGNLPPSSQPDS